MPHCPSHAIVIAQCFASLLADGLDKLMATYPEISFFVAAVDPNLSADGELLPGIGDAGDRMFGKSFRAVVENAKGLTPSSSANQLAAAEDGASKKRKNA